MKQWLYVVGLFLVSQDQPVLSAPTTESPQIFAPVAILGEGLTTCSEYSGDPDRAVMRVSWVMGYLTGANSRAVSPFRLVGKDMTAEGIDGWLKTYCARNQTSTIGNAAERLRQDLELHGG